MGWCHPIAEGPGVYLGRIDQKKYLENIPKLGVPIDDDLFRREFPRTKFPHLSEMNETQKILFLGANANVYYGYCTYNEGNEDLTVEQVDGIMSQDYGFENVIISCLSTLFALRYGYPTHAFKSCIDYNGDRMFYLSAQFPFSESEKALASLTREKYQEQLVEFFSILEGEPVSLELCTVEEYIKE